ncbi:MAG: L-seryl-tRNA(Sec) selenium transferase [Acidobacteria bacterium RIFCSPHIGHO2_12_FULL_67_30]|nr:MAG: L-seryl-tRNA(Sec) selenium transferase [Acidobacteria bacterium RIFCSPHIGHO2_12_FULL_67_30]
MPPRAARKTAVPLPERLRRLPSVDELLAHDRLRELIEEVGRPLVVAAARQTVATLRGEIRRGLAETELAVRLAHLEQEVAAETRELLGLSLRPVINATGVVLHTNLGRAPLSRAAAERVAAVATQYSNLEFDLGRGARGRRDVHAGKFLDRLLGAEASLVVNNNAAAVLLALNTLAAGGEVVVSRGELIEIGESFRIPDILARSGAKLVEVGTTNRTRLADYARAITRQTRLVLRVHPSNFRLVGFTERPALEELAQLARHKRLPLVEDLGSGLLVDLAPQGLDEPLAAASLGAGVDLVTFSGDKLLGGPQAGILAGKRKLVEACRRNPLFRALRVDKMTYAALEATLASFLRGAADDVPALRMIRLTAEEIGARAETLRAELAPALGGRAEVSVRAGESVAGGGSTPGTALPTKLLVVAPRAMSAAELAARLRRPDASGRPPVIARVEADRVLFDLRTVFPEQEAALAAALRAAFS